MFEEYLDSPTAFTDTEAGFDAAGVNLEPEEDAEPEMSMEDMIFEHFLDQLVEQKQNSLNYQNKMKDENTSALQEADKLRRKLGS